MENTVLGCAINIEVVLLLSPYKKLLKNTKVDQCVAVPFMRFGLRSQNTSLHDVNDVQNFETPSPMKKILLQKYDSKQQVEIMRAINWMKTVQFSKNRVDFRPLFAEMIMQYNYPYESHCIRIAIVKHCIIFFPPDAPTINSAPYRASQSAKTWTHQDWKIIKVWARCYRMAIARSHYWKPASYGRATPVQCSSNETQLLYSKYG